jgi:hypothetical protein
MLNLRQHTYEEIREVVIDVLLNPLPNSVTHHTPGQWANLLVSVGIVFFRREGRELHPSDGERGGERLHPDDRELVRDVFWDLFRQGVIILGNNDANPMWPWFRLSHFGEKTLQSQNPYRFHDTTSFLTMVRKEVPDVSSEAVYYLDEAVAAFYAGCLLASCVMLGVAAEAEFLRLVDVATASATHGATFAPVLKSQFIRGKITSFSNILKPLFPKLPKEAVEDLETNFMMIQSVLRIARNEAGHPTAATPGREQVYVYLQLFTPFARQLMRLRKALA